MEGIESGETADEGFGFIGNRIPVRAVEFYSGIDEGGGVVRTKGG